MTRPRGRHPHTRQAQPAGPIVSLSGQCCEGKNISRPNFVSGERSGCSLRKIVRSESKPLHPVPPRALDDMLPQIPLLILCGGRGTRLGSLCAKCPKPMLPVAGSPFLAHVVKHFRKEGIRHFVFLTGYRADVIQRYFEAHAPPASTLHFLRESTPLGTGGAVAQAVSRLRLEGPFLVVNGDTFSLFSVRPMIAALSNADGAVATVLKKSTARFGTLSINAVHSIVSFHEKEACRGHHRINAGFYAFHPHLFVGRSVASPSSLETDWFPFWLREGCVFRAVFHAGPFLDIGTPDDYAQAAHILKKPQRRKFDK